MLHHGATRGWLCVWLAILCARGASAWSVGQTSWHRSRSSRADSTPRPASPGDGEQWERLLNPIAKFIQGRQGQFVKMGSSQDESVSFGPPGLIMIGFPDELSIEIVRDVVATAAPKAWADGMAVANLRQSDLGSTLRTLLTDLDSLAAEEDGSSPRARAGPGDLESVSILFFSGMSDDDLRSIARAVATVAWQEHSVRPAVSKAGHERARGHAHARSRTRTHTRACTHTHTHTHTHKAYIHSPTRS